jgi:hypothetical protein
MTFSRKLCLLGSGLLLLVVYSSSLIFTFALITNVGLVTMGDLHVCVVEDSTSQTKCFGGNEYGTLGLDMEVTSRGMTPIGMGVYLPFVNLGTNRTIVDMDAGSNFNCAILDTLKIKCWGLNSYGQLGLGSSVSVVGLGPNDMGDDLPYVNLGNDVEVSNITCGDRQNVGEIMKWVNLVLVYLYHFLDSTLVRWEHIFQ